jgi:hypothetical protein
MLKQGLEVLKIFKNHSERTSLLDDFGYYENRQRVMHDERNRLPYRTFLRPLPLHKPEFSDSNKKSSMETSKIPSQTSAESEEVSSKPDGNLKERNEEDTTSVDKKLSSLTINPTGTDSEQTSGSHLNQSQAKTKPAPSVSDQKTVPSEVIHASLSDDNDIVKVGSVPIKVTGSPPIATVGTIPPNPGSLQK